MKISVILYLSNKLSDGTYPITLRITQGNARKYMSLGISCSKELWDVKKHIPKRSHPNKEAIDTVITGTLHTFQAKLLDLLSHQKVVTPSALIQAVEADRGKKETSTIFSFFDLVIDRFLQAGKVGTANVYKDAKRSLKNFTTKTNLLFADIDQTFLNNYEVFLRRANLAETSMSVYFRTLRSLFNKAIQENLINANIYPFKEFSVAKFNTDTRKRAITKEEMKKIADLEIDPASSLSETRHYFLFSFYGRGINFRDISELRWKDLVGEHIFYTRAKTGKILQFKLLPPTKAIIEHYRSLTGSHPENYIFPILDRLKHITPLQIDYRVTKVLKRVNKGLKELAQLAQVDAELTFYVARHSFATAWKKSGISMDMIGEAMGHKSLLVTERYLKSFENEEIDRANECLLW